MLHQLALRSFLRHLLFRSLPSHSRLPRFAGRHPGFFSPRQGVQEAALELRLRDVCRLVRGLLPGHRGLGFARMFEWRSL